MLLLDEPLTALDALLRERLRVDIDALLRRLGITAIYVTHDQAEAMALGDRIVVMSHGNVAQVGTPREIYFRPSNRFVADFIGTMNRVRGVVSDGVFRTAAGRIPWNAGGDGEIEVLFRPENLTITQPGGGHLAGVVETAFFLGDRTRVIVRGDGDTVLVAEAPDRPTAIFMHHPPFLTGITHMDVQNCDAGDALGALIESHPQVMRVMCGHVHRPIQLQWHGVTASIAPSPSHNVALDLREDGPPCFFIEPAACQLHQWREDTGLISHLSFIGEFAGPYPFFDEHGNLID